MVIPFFVTDSVAQVPKSVRVYSMSRLRVGEMESRGDRGLVEIEQHKWTSRKLQEFSRHSAGIDAVDLCQNVLGLDENERRSEPTRVSAEELLAG